MHAVILNGGLTAAMPLAAAVHVMSNSQAALALQHGLPCAGCLLRGGKRTKVDGTLPCKLRFELTMDANNVLKVCVGIAFQS